MSKIDEIERAANDVLAAHFDREIDAWNAAMDRKEAEMDKFGYGRDPSKPPAKVVGLDAFARPPREDYVRATVECHGFTLEPAVEYRAGDNFDAIATSLRRAADGPWSAGFDQMQAAYFVAGRLAERFPDRAYFVEVWQEGREGFAQCVQPYGYPRNR